MLYHFVILYNAFFALSIFYLQQMPRFLFLAPHGRLVYTVFILFEDVICMAKAVKTNVLRHLDARKIPYETREYAVEDDNFDGKLVAGKTGLDPEMIYKTLVLTGDRQSHLVCVIPVEKELDLKAVARASGNKSVAMLPQKDLLPLTGYLRGGCSPIGMKKLFPTYLDEAAAMLETISVSAGVRGCQVILAKGALISETRAKLAALCRE